LLRGTTGAVWFDGSDVSRLATHRIARRGLAYVPAERHLFPHMTAAENLALGAFPGRPESGRAEVVFELFPRLAERRKQNAGTMSGGEQQMLAVGRALMSNPKVLMLDEPTTGLAPRLAVEAYNALARLRDAGLTLVVAEQQVPLALELASRGYVLENGRVELAGTSEELARNPNVQRAYLGVA
jgi:branched-chain amino acid transport system ATP-binding protein